MGGRSRDDGVLPEYRDPGQFDLLQELGGQLVIGSPVGYDSWS